LLTLKFLWRFLLNAQAQGVSGKNEQSTQTSWRGAPEARGAMQLHRLHRLKAGPGDTVLQFRVNYTKFFNTHRQIYREEQWTMIYCFIWLSQQTGALQEAIALSKPTTIVNIRANENAMTQWLISVNKEGCCVVQDWW